MIYLYGILGIRKPIQSKKQIGSCLGLREMKGNAPWVQDLVWNNDNDLLTR